MSEVADIKVDLGPGYSIVPAVQGIIAGDQTLQRIFRGVGSLAVGKQVAELITRRGVMGIDESMTVHEALIRCIYAQALNGNIPSQKLLMDRLLPTTSRVELRPAGPQVQDMSDLEIRAEIKRMEDQIGPAPITS